MISKKILLAGIAAGALVAASSANALVISSATVNGLSLSTVTTPTTYKLATQALIGSSGISTTSSTVVVGTSAAIGAAGTYVMTFNYTGISGFTSTAPTLVASGGTACTTSTALSSGGTTTSQSVSFFVVVPSSCTTGNNVFTLTAPFTLKSATNVTVSATFTNGGTVVDNSPTTNTPTLVAATSGYQVIDTATAAAANAAFATAATASDGTTQLALPTFNSFTVGQGFDNVIGYVGVLPVKGLTSAADSATDIYLDLSGTAAKDVLTQALTFTPTITGNVTGLALTLQPLLSNASCTSTGAVSLTNSGSASASTTAVASGAYCVAVAPATGNTAAIPGGTYTASVTPTVPTASTAVSPAAVLTQAASNVALEPIVLAGTNLYIPWVNDASTAGVGNQSIIRIGNIGKLTTATSATVTLLNPTGAATAPAASCNVFSLPASGGQDLTISSSQLAACFGNFGRSDVLITLPTAYTNISAKMRIQNSSTGLFTEQSVGAGAYSAINN